MSNLDIRVKYEVWNCLAGYFEDSKVRTLGLAVGDILAVIEAEVNHAEFDKNTRIYELEAEIRNLVTSRPAWAEMPKWNEEMVYRFEAPWATSIRVQLRLGNKIQAIRELRHHLDLTLTEAKSLAENLADYMYGMGVDMSTYREKFPNG